jgi:phosphatidylinositol alpha-mannosyltransferase
MSRAAADALASDYGHEAGVTVVPGGVDLAAFAPAARRAQRPTLLYSGALQEPRKGVAVLLAALPAIAAQEPDVQLWLSGPGDPATLLAGAPAAARERVRSLGVGEAGAQGERYGRAWVTCLPSRYDSFGLTLLESLACGTPIVASTHAAPQELVDEGITGELCAAEDPASLARACLRALALARRPEIAATCRAAAEPFDWERGIAPRYERLYAGR